MSNGQLHMRVRAASGGRRAPRYVADELAGTRQVAVACTVDARAAACRDETGAETRSAAAAGRGIAKPRPWPRC
ncbi:hypothetical protein HBB16_06375 [Pseudonocardia sp. MCCB 268]|nr:hypothetical protein [Pseudonocardia cytotoxica]